MFPIFYPSEALKTVKWQNMKGSFKIRGHLSQQEKIRFSLDLT